MSSTFGRDLRRSWPGLLISLAALVVVFLVIDWQEFIRALRLANYRMFLPAFFVFMLGLGARTFAWRTLLKEGVSFRKTFFTLNEGYLLNNLFPFRLGEIGRALLLSRSTDLSFLRVFSTIIVERIIDLALVLSALVLTLPFVAGADEWARPTVFTMAPLILASFFLLYFAARNQERVKRWLAGLQEKIRLLQRFRLDQIETFFQGLAALTEIRRFLLVSGGLAAAWLLVIYHYYLVLLAFVPEGKFLWAAFGIGVIGLGVAIPSAPGGLGVVQGVVVAVFPPLFGIDPAVAFAYALVVHGFYLAITSLLGLVGLAQDGASLMQVYRDVRSWFKQ